MEIRIWKKIYLTPWIRLNLYTKGWSLSFGHNGIGWLTIGKSGLRGTISTEIPGVYLSEKERWKDLKP
jgi:hypothetical protein